jgi:hypothetical protein
MYIAADFTFKLRISANGRFDPTGLMSGRYNQLKSVPPLTDKQELILTAIAVNIILNSPRPNNHHMRRCSGEYLPPLVDSEKTLIYEVPRLSYSQRSFSVICQCKGIIGLN